MINDLFGLISQLFEGANLSVSGFLFGYVGGEANYPIIGSLDSTKSIKTFLILTSILFILVFLTERLLKRLEWLCIELWMVFGFIFQMAILNLKPKSASLESLILSPPANGFYMPHSDFDTFSFLNRFQEISATYGGHVGSNMPGKVLFFKLLETLQFSPTYMAYGIIIISNIGGVFAYHISRRLFKSKIAGFYSLLFYLFMPSKLAFFPLLNTITPVLILATFYTFLSFLNKKNLIWLIILGILTYLNFLFEPTPLVLGIIFLAYIYKASIQNDLTRKEITLIFLMPIGSFFLVHLFMIVLFSFDIFATFLYLIKINSAYYQKELVNKYWFFENIRVFFINSGLIQSFIALSLFTIAVKRVIKPVASRDSKKFIEILKSFDAGTFLCVSLIINFLILNSLGVNRAETIRFWIFMAVFLQFIAAFVSSNAPKYLFYSILGATILQCCLTLFYAGLALPGF